MLYHENELHQKGYDLIIGVDEAGRGPLAGPVVAAAVALRETSFKSVINDSKKLSDKQRQAAFPEIIEKSFYGIALVSEKIIDRVNILDATKIAMQQAVKKLTDKLTPEHTNNIFVLIDGNMRLEIGYPYESIVKGDSKSMSIAAASILAKVTRDRIMCGYDKIFPLYDFMRHKGYPTEKHRMILKKYGPSSIHRMTFCGVQG